VSASAKSGGPEDRFMSKRPQRAQPTLVPGASAGIRCSKSQSGQATAGGDTLVFTSPPVNRLHVP